ncbi:hypothetical protein V6N11_039343 [Hibiscus sabdariffa]|uniref:Uncharacterized protein n=1 Tax=Hibiscus sabdariffa TaxID=183260 RepID=A0ABR2SMR3_9ROSI
MDNFSVISAGNLTLESSGVPVGRPPEAIIGEVSASLERSRSPSLIQELPVIKKGRTPDVGSITEGSGSKGSAAMMDTTLGESMGGGVAQPVTCDPTMNPAGGRSYLLPFRDILAGAKSVSIPQFLVSDLDVDVPISVASGDLQWHIQEDVQVERHEGATGSLGVVVSSVPTAPVERSGGVLCDTSNVSESDQAMIPIVAFEPPVVASRSKVIPLASSLSLEKHTIV